MVRVQRSAALALLLIFFGAHLACLPTTLEDLDSINFALGVRHFDVAKHQPHPPGYPVFIALAKVSTAGLRALHVDASAPRGLAIWSAIAGAVALPGLFLFLRRIGGGAEDVLPMRALDPSRAKSERLAQWTTMLVAASPVYWFTALRPLSDTTGFCAAIWPMALLAGRPRPRALLVGACFAGIAVGVRSQTAVLTMPMLLTGLIVNRQARVAISAAAAFAVGVAVWALPLVLASGGFTAYLHALGSQAGEDFSGVVMLWTHHSPRVVAFALVNTFVWPWDWSLGVGMCVLAALGAARLTLRAPRATLMLVIGFVPYAIFHLLFQETATTRYALPLVVPVAYAAMAALEGASSKLLPVGASAIALLSLAVALPASSAYAREGAPVFRAFDDMTTTAHGGERVDAIGLHASIRRAAEWAGPIMPAPIVTGHHGEEWESLVALWRAQPDARVWFVADPPRTDLQLFDAHARDLTRRYRWGFVEQPFVGGARPDDVDWYRMRPPRWMLDRGWSLTAEVGGVSAGEGAGPDVSPAIAWLRRGAQDLTVLVGGRNLGGPKDGADTLTATLGAATLASVPAAPGYFVQRFTVPSALLNGGTGYVPLAFSAGKGNPIVSLEQFDAEPSGVPMVAYEAGWYEPEYDAGTGHSWRWMSGNAALWVRPVGRAVTLRISGESPLRYFKTSPHVRILAGGREVTSFDPTRDFEWTIALPDDTLSQAGGRLTIESSASFVPADAGALDQRRLALRIYSVSVE